MVQTCITESPPLYKDCKNATGDRAYPSAQARQISNQQWTVMRARVGHVSSVKCEVLESAKRKAIIRSYPRHPVNVQDCIFNLVVQLAF